MPMTAQHNHQRNHQQNHQLS